MAQDGKHYYDQKTPRDAWTFSGTKGLNVTQRFTNEQVDFAWVYAYPDYLGQLDTELWSDRVVLEAGEALDLSYEIEVSR